jgi:hypothetical protein
MRIFQLLFLLLITVSFVACKKKNTVQPQNSDAKTIQISKKWRMVEYYINNVSVKLADGDYLQLNSNKTYTERKYKVTINGNWEWQENQTQITMNNGIWKILTLSDIHLELEKLNSQPTEK